MSVHYAISEHSRRQAARIENFNRLDELRERHIEEAVAKCLRGEAFSVAAINEATAAINELARQGIVPTRQTVTEQMVRDYAVKLKA
ncbi:DUF2533 family protein [Paenibacillus contaminans]|uniref:DUF2533 domain-containing protein n=1 Tax=Paenibacillus contaminans TaxID=450362 RepID=A0A329MC52_9BACL|nr:DUF2533 family protein [Paenibacillus contaminans]RAV17669.1 DUF2533 domain-containing protein [Paenibacillus contaminans]